MRPSPQVVLALLLGLTCGLTLTTRPANAQSRGSDGDRIEGTRRWKRANDAFKAGAYADAIRDYQDAYRLLPISRLLFNIAQCYRLAGDPLHAIEYYRKFLVVAEGRGTEEARAHLAKLEREVGARAAPDPEAWPPAPAPGGPVEPVVTAEPSPTTPRLAERAPPPGGRGVRFAGLGLGAAGLGALAVGIYFGVDARAQAARVARDCPCAWSEIEAIDARGRRSERRATLLSAIGTVAVLGGSALYYFGWRAARREDDGVGVALVAGGGEAFWRASF